MKSGDLEKLEKQYKKLGAEIEALKEKKVTIGANDKYKPCGAIRDWTDKEEKEHIEKLKAEDERLFFTAQKGSLLDRIWNK